jgi:macrolide transport system ATP-binding/permease protein
VSLLRTSGIARAFGPVTVLEEISFQVQAGERVGLVGANGSGKSTLLRIITGETAPDAGQVSIAEGVEVGYLPQEGPVAAATLTIDALIRESVGGLRSLEQRLRALEGVLTHAQGAALDEALTEYGDLAERFERRGGYQLDYQIDAVLAGLGLAHLPRERQVGTLSGGERSRVLLAGLLLQSPDLLLLDEPTNHLDFASAAWLGRFLAAYRGAFVAVSHDRHFLNGAVNRIVEVDEYSHTLNEYPGNYDQYRAAKDREQARHLEQFERQQDEIKELRKAIKVSARQVSHNRPPTDNDKVARHFFREQVEGAISRNVRNAEERLRRIEAAPVPKPARGLRINPDLDPAEIRSEQVIVADGLTRRFGKRTVLDDVSFVVGSRARVVIVGENGAGKSTLLDLIAGLSEPDGGTVRIAPGARLGYLDQDARALDRKATLIESYLEGLHGQRDELVNGLFHYGFFVADDLGKGVGQLSLGQRRKLQLAKLMAQHANVLLLDEPTNHLSLDLLDQFERALADFAGPVVIVSHDRWLIERFQGQIWELRDGRLHQHLAAPAEVVDELVARRAAAPLRAAGV